MGLGQYDVGDLIDDQFGSVVAERYQRGEVLVLALGAKLDQVHAAISQHAGRADDLALPLREVEGRYRAYLRELRLMAFLAVLYPMRQAGRTIGDALRVLTVDASVLPSDPADFTDEHLQDLMVKVNAWRGCDSAATGHPQVPRATARPFSV